MFISRIHWQFALLIFFVFLSTPVLGDNLGGLLRSVNFAHFLPVGTQFSSGTIIGDSGSFDRSSFRLTGGTSEIVRTDRIREGNAIALQLNGTLEKLFFAGVPPYLRIVFARPTSDISRFADDFIELDGDTVSLFDILTGPSEGKLIAGSAWSYRLQQLDAGGYALFFENGLVFENIIDLNSYMQSIQSYSVSSQSPGLLVNVFAVQYIPEPSSLTIMLISVAFCGTNMRIARRLQ